MGAGASNFDPSAQRASVRYLCHECNNVCLESELSTSDIGENVCPMCRSTFIEEIAVLGGRSFGNESLIGGGGSGLPGVNGFLARQNLTSDQSRRLANAALMLRLLDAHLRQELDMFQRLHQAGLQESRALDQPKLSGIMKDKLRYTQLTMDMICSLPSCPICYEDYVVKPISDKKDNDIVQLPCSHFFHTTCVIPWLDAKKTCPICRFELTNELPTLTELMRFNEDELIEKIKECNEEDMSKCDDGDVEYSKMDKQQLVNKLLEHITKRRAKFVDEKPTPVDLNYSSSDMNYRNSSSSTSNSPLRQTVSQLDSLLQTTSSALHNHRSQEAASNFGSLASLGSGSRLRVFPDESDDIYFNSQNEAISGGAGSERFGAFYDLISQRNSNRLMDDGEDEEDDDDNDEEDDDDDDGIGISNSLARSIANTINNNNNNNNNNNYNSSRNESRVGLTPSSQYLGGNRGLFPSDLLLNSTSSAPSSLGSTLSSQPSRTYQFSPNYDPNPNPNLLSTRILPTAIPCEASASDLVDSIVNAHMERTGLNSYLGSSISSSSSSNSINNNNSSSTGVVGTTYIVRSSNNGSSFTPVIARMGQPS